MIPFQSNRPVTLATLSMVFFCLSACSASAADAEPAAGQAVAGRSRGQMFSPEQLLQRMDKNQDGQLSSDEVPEKMRQYFDKMDTDQSGGLSKEELQTAMSRRQSMEGRQQPGANQPGQPEADKPDAKMNEEKAGDTKEADELFVQLDRNKDGKLSKEEFRQGLTTIRQQADKTMPVAADSEKPAGRAGRKGSYADVDPKQLFKLWDKNQDGALTGDEIPKQMGERIGNADNDGDGKITMEEFTGYRERMDARYGDKNKGKQPENAGNPEMESRIDQMFTRMDKNKDDKLTTDEIPELLRERLSRADLDEDGVITKEEVKQGMRYMQMMGQAGDRPGAGRFGNRFQPPATPQGLFDQQDRDADGRVSAEEAQGKLKENFDKFDTNQDKKLDLQEVEAGLKD